MSKMKKLFTKFFSFRSSYSSQSILHRNSINYTYNFGIFAFVVLPLEESNLLGLCSFILSVIILFFSFRFILQTLLNTSYSGYFLILFASLITLTTLTYFFPRVFYIFSLSITMFYLSSFLSQQQIIFIIPFFNKSYLLTTPSWLNQIAEKFIVISLKMLKKTSLLQFIEKIHIDFFYKISLSQFEGMTLICHSLAFCYIVANRFLLLKIDSVIFTQLLYFILFFSMLAIYFRILISFSIVVIRRIRLTDPLSLNPLLLVDPSEPISSAPNAGSLDLSSKSPALSPKPNNPLPPPPLQPPRFTFWHKAGVVAAIGATIFAGAGIYINYQEHLLQRQVFQEQVRQNAISNRLGEVQNREFGRQNDLDEVDKKLRSLENYKRKYNLGDDPNNVE